MRWFLARINTLVQNVVPWCGAFRAAEPSLGDSCVTSENPGSPLVTCCSLARGQLQSAASLSTKHGLHVRAGAGRSVDITSATTDCLWLPAPRCLLSVYLPASSQGYTLTWDVLIVLSVLNRNSPLGTLPGWLCRERLVSRHGYLWRVSSVLLGISTTH